MVDYSLLLGVHIVVLIGLIPLWLMERLGVLRFIFLVLMVLFASVTTMGAAICGAV